MNCTECQGKTCRSGHACGGENLSASDNIALYRDSANQVIVQSAAKLVDGGLAGSLSRLEELGRFIIDRGYTKVGVAYCYGLEVAAKEVVRYLKNQGIPTSAVSCTVGALAQNQVNQQSQACGVSCNPLGQAAQLQSEKVDFAIQFGLCLGHDVLFTKAFQGDQTVLLVKDRTQRPRKSA